MQNARDNIRCIGYYRDAELGVLVIKSTGRSKQRTILGALVIDSKRCRPTGHH